MQRGISGPITNKKDPDLIFLECKDCLSKHPTNKLFDKTNGPNVVKLLDDYVQSQGIPRRLSQAQFLIGKKLDLLVK